MATMSGVDVCVCVEWKQTRAAVSIAAEERWCTRLRRDCPCPSEAGRIAPVRRKSGSVVVGGMLKRGASAMCSCPRLMLDARAFCEPRCVDEPAARWTPPHCGIGRSLSLTAAVQCAEPEEAGSHLHDPRRFASQREAANQHRSRLQTKAHDQPSQHQMQQLRQTTAAQ